MRASKRGFLSSIKGNGHVFGSLGRALPLLDRYSNVVMDMFLGVLAAPAICLL